MTQNSTQSTPLPVSNRPSLASPDKIALGFLVACLLLAGPLIFADRLSQSVTLFLFVALLLAFAGRAVLTRTLLPRTAVDLPNLLALALVPVGFWASVDLSTSWPAAAKVIAGFAFFYGFAGLAGTKWMRLVPWFLLVAAAGIGLIVFLTTRWMPSKIPVLPASLYSLLPSMRLPLDVNGIHPNLAGHLMALLLLPAVALALWAPNRPLRWAAAAIAVLLALVLLLSQSRGAWISAAVALVMMPWLRYRRWWIVVLTLAVVGIAVSVLVRAAPLETLIFPVITGDEVAINTLPGRLEIWGRAIALLQDFGLTGGGAGNFEQVVMTLYPPFFTGVMGGFGHAHNAYLQAAVDFGVPGLVVFLAFLVGLAASLVTAVQLGKAQPAEGIVVSVAIGLFGSLLVVAIHGLADAPLATPRVYALVFMLFGLGAAAGNHLVGLAGRSVGVDSLTAQDADPKPDPLPKERISC